MWETAGREGKLMLDKLFEYLCMVIFTLIIFFIILLPAIACASGHLIIGALILSFVSVPISVYIVEQILRW